MKYKPATDSAGRTFVVVFQTGDEVAAGLRDFARRENIHAAHFTAIGALSEFAILFFDWDTKQYRQLPISEQVEVLALTGNIARRDGEPVVHAHLVAGRADGSTAGGHFQEGRVRPTLEVFVTEVPVPLERNVDPDSGLALLTL